MTIDALDTLAELRAVGLCVTGEGEVLRVRPSSKLTHARRQVILEHKPELLAALEAERAAAEAIHQAGLSAGCERPLSTQTGNSGALIEMCRPSPNPPQPAARPGQPHSASTRQPRATPK
jgi:hypothetical protein